MDKILKKLIYEIKEEEVKILSSEQGAINTLIEKYKEDIFEEFLEYVKKDKYDTTFNQYMRYSYKQKITKVDDLYFVSFYDDGYTRETIKQLFDFSKAKTLKEIKEFCDKYNENDNS